MVLVEGQRPYAGRTDLEREGEYGSDAVLDQQIGEPDPPAGGWATRSLSIMGTPRRYASGPGPTPTANWRSSYSAAVVFELYVAPGIPVVPMSTMPAALALRTSAHAVHNPAGVGAEPSRAAKAVVIATSVPAFGPRLPRWSSDVPIRLAT